MKPVQHFSAVASLLQQESVWERLRKTQKPIVLYGMGLGAEKILAVFAQYDIPLQAVFASDGFVRGHSFAGFRVLSFSEMIQKYKDPLIVISFASQLPQVINRFSEIDRQFETVAPDVPVAGGGLFTPAYLAQHLEELEKVYSLLADEQSRHVFLSVLSYKINGRISFLRQCETPRQEIFETVLSLSKEEIFADLGAYTGDTIAEFLQYAKGNFKRILAMEADPKNFRKLTAAVKERNLSPEQVLLCNQAAWSCSTVLPFACRAGRNSSLLEEGNVWLPACTLDSVANGEPVTCIKMDVEGAEWEALQGCVQTIRHWNPKLMIAAYHRNEDLFRLPLLIREICPAYRLFLRHHPYVPAWETNLYAVPKTPGS